MTQSLFDRLAEPFPMSDIKWLVITTSKDKKKALVVPYIDARAVMDRLDEVFGVDGWKDKYELLHDGNVMCHLSIWSEAKKQWITKCDIGGEGSVGDKEDKAKGAYSSALKRAAVKFGVGRYLYHANPQWVDYDEQRKMITNDAKKNLSLPPQFLPRPKPVANGKPTAPVPQNNQAPLYVISSEIARLETLCKESGVTMATVLGFFKADQVHNLTKVEFLQAEKKLLATIEQRKREEEIVNNAERLAQQEAMRNG